MSAQTKVTTAKPVDFDREIRPILSDTCFTCHGPDEKARISGLRLDTKEGAFADRGGYRVIVPGKSAESKLYLKISSKDDSIRMPPVWSGRSLTAAQIDLICRWIDEGAKWETHWAYLAPKRPPLPEVKDLTWPRNPIDYFVLAQLEREGLKPSPPADKRTLIRRVTFDLTGLPPTPAEVDAFLADHSQGSYGRVVDRLLHSPQYGERMATQWLDLARYADTQGYHVDPQRDMWHWRDWVIDAYNRNMPFDQFTIEQLAGDLLPHPTLEQRIATGFNRNHMINFEGGAIPAEYHNEYVVDRVDATATTWMGTTLACARCHDHKYDPFKQRDFYRFYAFFNNVPEKGLDGREGNVQPVVQIPSPEEQRRLEELKRRICALAPALPDKQIASLQSEWEKTALATVPAAAQDGLLAHYEFEKDLADSSGHNPPGITRRGGVTYGYGAVGKAADFSGETHVELGDADALNPSRPFALAFWFRTSSELEMALAQKMGDSDEHRAFEILLDKAVYIGPHKRTSHVIVRLIHHWPDDAIQVRTKDRVLVTTLRHLTINYDGSGKASGLRVFVDAQAQPTEVIQDHLTGALNSGHPLEIGNKQIGQPYEGVMDDLRIYDRPLAPSTIGQLFFDEPVRAILLGRSAACAEMERQPASGPTADPEDPLALQTYEDTPAYGVKMQCQSERDKLRDYFLAWAAPTSLRKSYAELKTLQKQKAELDKVIPTSMVMVEMKKPRETYVLVRGDYRNQTENVTPGVPSILPPFPKDVPANRLGLAKWLVDLSHPLTARVAVNRYWQMCFGTGIVKTAEDFGSQGDPPSHPDLLDWLATEYIRNGWDTKALMRLVVTSATYQQSSRITPELLEKDPENRLLARGPRFRLPAEFVRDNALAVSGLLNAEMGGPSVFPYQPAGLWEEMAYGEGYTAQRYPPSRAKELYRRSMYTFWKRTVPPPSLATFDAPDREKCTARRLPTNTPLQALVLENDPTYVEAARALAVRAMTEAGRDPVQRIRYAFRLATARNPAPEELSALRKLAEEELARYEGDRNAAVKLLEVGESRVDKNLRVSELAAWTTVASAILNLDETITKE